MRLLYLADIRFPMERANGIQTIETCHALARRGVEVEPAVRRSDARSDEACLAFYGLAPVKNLRLRRVLLPGRLGFLAYALTLLLRSDRRCCTARSKSLTSLCRLQSHPAQYVSGIPSAAILLSISHPIRCSTRCLANVRARISGPMIAL